MRASGLLGGQNADDDSNFIINIFINTHINNNNNNNMKLLFSIL